jgi:tartrate-resistant acid phosphatase type 5
LAALPSPALAQTDTIRFAAFGDFGKGTGTTAVAQLVNNQAPDFIVSLGDSCYGATPPIATQVGTPYGTWVADSRFWPSLGNHEFSDACGGGSAASGYRAYFTLPNNERYYDFVEGPVHFFAVNSETEPDGKSATSKQALWVKERVAASTSPWQVVFFHHPSFSSGSSGSTPTMKWPFEQWGVDAVLTAHDHIYERIIKDGDGNGVKLPYFVSGLGGKSKGSIPGKVSGSENRYNADFGALFITATPTAMTFEFRKVGGAIIDTYSIQKSAAQPTKFEWKTVP